MIKISCVLITYKRELYIVERALKSIINQTYKCLDIVLVNDYPEDRKHSDALKEMANRYGIKYVSYEHNLGACFARNYGAKNTEGDYIAFIDDDDEWVVDKLEVQLKCAEKNKADLVYGPFYLEKKGKKKLTSTHKTSGNIIEKLLAFNFIGGTSVPLIRRSIFEQLNGFDVELLSSQDYDLWIRIAKQGLVYYVDHKKDIEDLGFDIQIFFRI